MGTGTNALTSNPLFVSVASKNFHLQSTSPARGTGTAVGLSVDRDGVAYGNPPSRGAYEYI